jgi:hypothetical protein
MRTRSSPRWTEEYRTKTTPNLGLQRTRNVGAALAVAGL